MDQFADSLPTEDITIDYESHTLPDGVRQYKPKVYKDGTGYCCCYGPDPQKGIFECGYSPEEAMKSWSKAYLKEGIKIFERKWR
jgi:hypothetical protein